MTMLNTQAAIICGAALLVISTAHARDIVVGQSTALTGVLASSGVPMRLGAQICFDLVNEEGGVNGERIRFISLDDGYKVDETLKNVKGLIENDNVVVLVGGSGTSNNEALLKQKILANANLAVVGLRRRSIVCTLKVSV